MIKLVPSEAPLRRPKESLRCSTKCSTATNSLFCVLPSCISSFVPRLKLQTSVGCYPEGNEGRAWQRNDRQGNRNFEQEEKRQSYLRSYYGGKCKGPDPKEWWRTLWRRPLRTNKDGFSFTGRMHLHSLEAKASESGLMKREPQQLLGLQCKREGAGDRRRKTAKKGKHKWNCVGRRQEELFFLLPLQQHNTNEIRDICASHGGCLWLTLMQREHSEGGTSPEKVTSAKTFPCNHKTHVWLQLSDINIYTPLAVTTITYKCYLG